ncbi:MAG: doubled motif LPXTG anchor domain-containing protein, partial [Lachnospiraceae bacterium]|nr:doubled motif LPXTG anchor domain-containing protein [Lachnospiraceae bacterium]
YVYGADVTVAAAANAAGYTFSGWKTTDAAVAGGKFSMPAKAVELSGNFTANRDTKYTIEYFYQNDDGTYPQVASKDVVKTGTTATTAKVTDVDKVSERTGYVLDTTKHEGYEGEIAGDGSLVLSVYFKKQFTVSYEPGTLGTFAKQETKDLDFGVETPAFKGKTTGAEGYTFAGWDIKVAPTVTKDVVYTATWVANSDTKYIVEFYYQTDGSYPTTANDSSTRTGTTASVVEATETDKTPTAGYAFDTAASNVLTGTVTGDNGLVLKVYFKQQFTVTYRPGNRGSFAEQNYNGLDYGTNTPAFSGETTANGSYRFDGWDITIADKVTGNAVYTAQWRSTGGGGGTGGNGNGGGSTGPSDNGGTTPGGPGAPTVTIDPDAVPLANLPSDGSNGDVESLFAIDDEDVPLAALPKTGDAADATGLLFLISSMMLAFGVALKKRKEDQ